MSSRTRRATLAPAAFVGRGIGALTRLLRKPRGFDPNCWQVTDDEQQALQHWRACPDSAAWDALPLWMRVVLCGECGWLDAVWEACPELGREIDARRLPAITDLKD